MGLDSWQPRHRRCGEGWLDGRELDAPRAPTGQPACDQRVCAIVGTKAASSRVESSVDIEASTATWYYVQGGDWRSGGMVWAQGCGRAASRQVVKLELELELEFR